MQSQTKLFQPIKVGDVELKHRIVLAPLTRGRGTEEHVPLIPIVKKYYADRASVPGTLLISEGIHIAMKAGGLPFVPGIWSEEQAVAWKEINDAVHAKGSFIFAQLYGFGRAATPDVLHAEDPTFPYTSASPIKLSDRPDSEIAPRELTREEIKEYVELYVQAAVNAIEKAGFDGVEIHMGFGYQLDQFLQDTCNQRTDEYGGSVENRVRFPMEVVDAVADRVGSTKVGVRITPWSPFQDMRMKDPRPTFAYLTQQLKERHSDLAYLHVVEPRISGANDYETLDADESNDFIREIWSPRPLISAGGYVCKTAFKMADEKGDLIAFGRHYISNPDLPLRIMNGLATTPYNRDTFYLFGDPSGFGYSDYTFAQTAVSA